MSSRYTSDGKRRSSMTHARRGHQCEFCPKVAFGNGGQVSHGRWHVNRGHAVELVKHYGTYPPTSTRLFVASEKVARIAQYEADGFERVAQS
jgi:hypothetical protein